MERAIDPTYLNDQYGTTERLCIRLEAHQRYSERGDDFFDWVLDHFDPQPGDLVLDVGCGAGTYHPALCARGIRAVLGADIDALQDWPSDGNYRPRLLTALGEQIQRISRSACTSPASQAPPPA